MISSFTPGFLRPYVDVIIKRISFLYGLDYAKFFLAQYNNIFIVEVRDDLDDNTLMAFNRAHKKILINKNVLDDYHDISKLEYRNASLFYKSCFTHELLHALSVKPNGIGFVDYNSEDATGLNEGTTQMLTDDIIDNVENKYSDGYNTLKIVAKIIRNTFGNDMVVRSYFGDTATLEREMNSLSGNKYYFNQLNRKLTAINSISGKLKGPKVSSASKELYKQREINVFKDVILNLVIPKLRKLSINERKKYISRILTDIADDDELRNVFHGLLASYIKLDTGEIESEKYKMDIENESIREHSNFVSFVENDGDLKSRVFIKNNGDIYVLGSPNRKIESTEEYNLVYSKLFKLNRLDRFFTPTVISEYVKNIKAGKPLRIKRDSLLEKRIIFCGIRQILIDKDIYLLNSFYELDNSDIIKPVWINKKKSLMSFEDLKKVATKFYAKRESTGYNVYDRVTKKKVENPSIICLSLFANNWIFSASRKETRGEVVRGIEDAFSRENERSFDSILRALTSVYLYTDNFDKAYMERLVDSRGKQILRKLLSTSSHHEWTYEFISRYCGSSYHYQMSKGKPYTESPGSNYRVHKSDIDAEKLVSM